MKTKKSSNSKHWDKRELYTHLRMSTKNKKDYYFPTCLFQFHIVVTRAFPGALDTKWNQTLDRMLFHHKVQSHLHHTISDWDNLYTQFT